MSIDWAHIVGGTLRVLLVGALLGAGLPALFSIGMRLWDLGEGGEEADGTVVRRRPALAWLGYGIFGITALAVVYAILFMTKKSIEHYLGIHLPI